MCPGWYHHAPFGYWEENFQEWSIFTDNGVRTNDQADIFFSFDRIETWTGAIWMKPVFEKRVIEETADKRILMNADGLLAEVPKDGHATIPHFLKASIVTPDDWKRVKTERFRRDDPVRSSPWILSPTWWFRATRALVRSCAPQAARPYSASGARSGQQR